MTNERSGLRFDIYERVHVAEDLAGIQELDEIELVPHIRVNVEEDSAVLKGHLWLTGAYTGENADEGAKCSLEHIIPVEITMPLSRIERVEDIAVEIENFDVDLLSPRSLNVTGVLSLRGIEMRTDEDELQSVQADEEEIVFVHESDSRSADAVEPLQVQEQEPEAESAENRRIYPEEVGLPGLENPSDTEPVFEQDIVIEGDEPVEQKEEAVPVVVDESPEAEKLQEEEQTPEPVAAAEEKKETKLVFGSKKETAAEPVGQSQLLKSLFGGRDFRSADDVKEVEDREEQGRQDAVEWKKLFLSRDGGEQSFRRMRMCIVQKEESLETIAERYKLSAREIALHNRLADQQVAEGQIIYIPR